MNCEILKDYGIDFEQGFERCVYDEELYTGLLELFLEDDSFSRAKDAMAVGDYDNLFKCMHELKGACGNAGMTDLFAVVDKLVETLRKKEYTGDEIAVFMDRVAAEYHRTEKGVKEFLQLNK